MQSEPSGNIGHGNSSQLEQMRRGRRTSTAGDANQMSVTAADGEGLGQEGEADRTAVGGELWEQEGELEANGDGEANTT